MYFNIKYLFISCLLIICCCSIGANAQQNTNTGKTPNTTTAAHEEHDKVKTIVNAPPVMQYYPNPPVVGEVGKDGTTRFVPHEINTDEKGNIIIRPYQYPNGTAYNPMSRTSKDSNRDMTITYILVFTAALLVIFMIFLVIGLKYKSSINGKLKRLEQVKDMQSLEASNIRPLTTISPTGYVEDKRGEGFSNHSSGRKHQYAESISLQSSTSDGSRIENAYNYISDLDYGNDAGYNTGNAGYMTEQGYMTQDQYMYDKNMGMKYMPQLEMPPQPPNYDGPYHSTPASFGINKSDLKNLYSTPVDPYDTDEGGIMPMKPQNALYEINGMISPIQGSSPVMSPNSMMPSTTYAARNINTVGYDPDLVYNNNNYSDEQLMYDGVEMNPMMVPQNAVVSNYNQMRGEPRMKRKSQSELNKVKRGSIPDRSPGLYAPRNMSGSPMIRKGGGSVVSETRSAKSLLIDQMVHAMDIEAESDDTLSNYPINDDRSSVAGSAVNGRTRGNNGSVVGMSTNGGQYTKMTPTSSSSSLNKVDANRNYTNQAGNVNGKMKASEEDPLRKKKVKRQSIGKRERNRDFIARQPNIFSQESDSCYESNNSFNQSIYDEVKVFEVEEDEDLIINSSEEYGKYNMRK